MRLREILAEVVTVRLSEFVNEIEPELRKSVECLSLRLNQERVTFIASPGFDYKSVWMIIGECLKIPLLSYSQLLDEPELKENLLADIGRFSSDGDDILIDELERFAKNLDVASLYLNSYGFNRSDKLAENGLFLLSRIVKSIHEEAIRQSTKVCLYCFRKIDVGMACVLHRTKDGVGIRYTGKKVHVYLGRNSLNLLERYRIQRALMGDDVVFEGDGEFEALRSLCNLIGNEKWQDISVQVRSYVECEFPYVYKLIREKPFGAANFLECKKLIYSHKFLNNELDGSNSPYWFLRTLSLANLWFAAEAEMERPKIARAERNQQIKRMYEEKASFREIAEEVHCSISTVHNVVKAIKKDSAGL